MADPGMADALGKQKTSLFDRLFMSFLLVQSATSLQCKIGKYIQLTATKTTFHTWYHDTCLYSMCYCNYWAELPEWKKNKYKWTVTNKVSRCMVHWGGHNFNKYVWKEAIEMLYDKWNDVALELWWTLSSIKSSTYLWSALIHWKQSWKELAYSSCLLQLSSVYTVAI